MTVLDFLLRFSEAVFKDPWVLAKPLFLVGFLVYLFFAVIIVRQVKLMTQTLNGLLSLPLLLISIIHLGVAIGVFILTLVIL
jgi:hypothetical protein